MSAGGNAMPARNAMRARGEDPRPAGGACRDGVFLAAAAGFVLLGILCGQHTMFDFDSAQFALAVEEHDVLRHQPQPPGFVFYVWGSKALAAFPGVDAFVALRIAAMGLCLAAAAWTWRLALTLAGRTVARLASLLFLASPLVLFHGMITMIYPAEAFVSAVVAHACLRGPRRGLGGVAGTCLLAGAAGGLRMTAMGLLLPLVVFAVLRDGGWRSARRIVVAFLSGAAGVAAWFLPLLRVSGGLEGWLHANALLQEYVRSISFSGRGLEGFGDSLHRLATVAVFGFGVVKLPWILAALGRGSQAAPGGGGKAKPGGGGEGGAGPGGGPGRDAPQPAGRGFWILWIGPFLAFALLYHLPKPGYLLGVWPPLSILFSRSLLASRSWPRRRLALCAAALLDLGFFFLFPAERFLTPRLWALRQPKPALEYSLRWVFGRLDFLHDHAVGARGARAIEALRGEHGFPRPDVFWIGGPLARLGCWTFPGMPILSADSNRPSPYLFYRDRHGQPVSGTLRLVDPVRYVLVEGDGGWITLEEGAVEGAAPRRLEGIGILYLLGPGPVRIRVQPRSLHFAFPVLQVERGPLAGGS